MCTAVRRGSVDISLDRRVHSSAARERRKNKIINNNKNKMMKTLTKSKEAQLSWAMHGLARRDMKFMRMLKFFYEFFLNFQITAKG